MRLYRDDAMLVMNGTSKPGNQQHMFPNKWALLSGENVQNILPPNVRKAKKLSIGKFNTTRDSGKFPEQSKTGQTKKKKLTENVKSRHVDTRPTRVSHDTRVTARA